MQRKNELVPGDMCTTWSKDDVMVWDVNNLNSCHGCADRNGVMLVIGAVYEKDYGEHHIVIDDLIVLNAKFGVVCIAREYVKKIT